MGRPITTNSAQRWKVSSGRAFTRSCQIFQAIDAGSSLREDDNAEDGIFFRTYFRTNATKFLMKRKSITLLPDSRTAGGLALVR